MNRTRKKLVPTGQSFDRRHPLETGEVRITTFVPLQFKRRGIKKVVVGPAGVDEPVKVSDANSAISPTLDRPLLTALGRGLYWQHLLDIGTVKDTAEIAAQEGLHRVTVNDALRFALLAPDILAAALDGHLPRTFSLETLQRQTTPLDWSLQRRLMAELG
jgi:hypothetical protein